MTAISPVVYVLGFVGALAIGSLAVCFFIWFAGPTDVGTEYDNGHTRR